MRQTVIAVALIVVGCGEVHEDPPAPIVVEREIAHDADPPIAEGLPEPDEPEIDEAALARTERTFEREALPFDPQAIPVATMRVRRRRLAPVEPVDFAIMVPDVASETDLERATAIALLRIAGTEVEYQNDNDVIGIWQVARAVRASHCDNTRWAGRVHTQIAQCRTADGRIVRVADGERVEGAEETPWSALRRLSPFVMGARSRLRNHRQRWARRVDLSCEDPENYTGRGGWAALRDECEATAVLVQGLVDGSIRRRVTGRATPIAWGGRCEGPHACDDSTACSRGLARIPGTETSNALWCRAGSRGCAEPVVGDGTGRGHGGRAGVVYSDPVCAALDIPAPSRMQSLAASDDDGEDAPSDGEVG